MQIASPTSGLDSKAHASLIPPVFSTGLPASGPYDSVDISDNAIDKSKKVSDVASPRRKRQSTVMSHMIEKYNYKGMLRIRFVDSKNNVIYQIPSEMVARTEDLMSKPGTSISIAA